VRGAPAKNEARLLVVDDEPTGNLDEGTRDEIIALLEKLWKDLGLTLIVVTTTVRSPAGRSGWPRCATAACISSLNAPGLAFAITPAHTENGGIRVGLELDGQGGIRLVG
jgi:hypothetical protein